MAVIPRPDVIKLVAVGDGGVGKTTMLNVLVKGIYDDETKMTVGFDIFSKEVLIDGRAYSVVIWDLGGQDRFKFFLHQENDIFIKGTQGVLLIFDLTRFQPLEEFKFWVNLCRKENFNIPILLIGSKLDLDEQIVYKDSDLEEMKEEFKCIEWIRISSKTRENLDKIFKLILTPILKSN